MMKYITAVAIILLTGCSNSSSSATPACAPQHNFPAPGACRRSNAVVGLDATDPQARCFRVMLSPAVRSMCRSLPSLRPAASSMF